MTPATRARSAGSPVKRIPLARRPLTQYSLAYIFRRGRDGRSADGECDPEQQHHHRANPRGDPGDAGRPWPALLRAAVRRTRGDRLDRLYGPGQFRDQHPGRGPLRLRPPVGRARRQHDRHAFSGAFREARHRDAAQPRRDLPRPAARGGRLRALGDQRIRRHGDRPCRVHRRRDRPVAASAHSDAGRHGRRRAADARNSPFRALGLSADRDGDRRLRRHDRPVLSRRARRRAGRLGSGRTRPRDAPPSGRGGADARRRHRRRDGDAARDLPALGPHQRPGRRARRRRAAHADPLLQYRGDRRADRGGYRQHGDGDDGGKRLPRGPQRRRRDRDRLCDT